MNFKKYTKQIRFPICLVFSKVALIWLLPKILAQLVQIYVDTLWHLPSTKVDKSCQTLGHFLKRTGDSDQGSNQCDHKKIAKCL